MIDTIFDKLEKIDLSSINWRAFAIAFFGIFFMEAVHLLGIKFPIHPNVRIDAVTSKASVSNIDIMKMIRPKLEEKKNIYKLQKPTSFIPHSYAGSSYENSSSYIVINFDTGKVLAEKNMSKRLPIASLTKIMTAVVASDLGNLGELYTVSSDASSKVPTRIGVIYGEKMSLEELLHASLMTSANDATEVIREGIDAKYGNRIFVNAMNEKAKFLELGNTSYSNPQGFDSIRNYSSAEDLAVLSHYAIVNYPKIAEIVKKDYLYIAENKNHKQFDLYNWNGLLGVYPDVCGLKIGNTNEAGKTTIVLSERQGKKVLVVLLGAPGIIERDLWASGLLDLGFEKIAGLEPVNVSEQELYAKYSSWKY